MDKNGDFSFFSSDWLKNEPKNFKAALMKATNTVKSEEEISTIKITGLKSGINERELSNLVNFMEGFQSVAIFSNAGDVPDTYGLVRFSKRSEAENAAAMINKIFAEMNDYQLMLVKVNSAPPRSDVATSEPVASSATMQAIVQERGHYPPSCTLYVGVIDMNTTESQLQVIRETFVGQHGYRYTDWSHGARGISCFVRFDTISDAVAARDSHRELKIGYVNYWTGFAVDKY